MADGVEQIAAQVDPVGQTIEGYVRPNGLRIEKVPRAARRRPVLLREPAQRHQRRRRAVHQERQRGHPPRRQGGVPLQPARSSQIIAAVARRRPAIDPAGRAVRRIDRPRRCVPHLLKLDKYIDLVIPRGGESLIRAVVQGFDHPGAQALHRQLPHLRRRGDRRRWSSRCATICVNAKTSYPGGAVCNAVEHLLFHKDAAPRAAAKRLRGPGRQGRRDPRRRRDAHALRRSQARHRRRLGHRISRASSSA